MFGGFSGFGFSGEKNVRGEEGEGEFEKEKERSGD